MKNTLFALLSFILLSTPLAAAAQWIYSSDGSAITINGYTGPGGAVTIPDTIAGLPVTTLGDYALNYQASLTSITIPGSVTNPGYGAFESCANLTSVTILNGVTSIGINMFSSCTSLTSVTIPGSVTNIDDIAFSNCTNLDSVTILNGVIRIGAAFGNCTSLTDVTIPASVTSIGGHAFQTCTSLSTVLIPGSVTNIEIYAFWYCSNLTNVTIPGSVTSIGDGAFASCSSLSRVTILNGVTSIGTTANIGSGTFQDCTSLTSVTIPSSVTSIGQRAFYDCYRLQAVFFKGNAPSEYTYPFDNTSATVYYLPGTSGWNTTFANRPARLWNPLMQFSGIGPAGFGFNITGTPDIPIVIEAATNLANTTWVSFQSLTLTNGALHFSDPDWTNYPARFYRIRSP